jgi:DNA-binding CsgD family transcriptional regulator
MTRTTKRGSYMSLRWALGRSRRALGDPEGARAAYRELLGAPESETYPAMVKYMAPDIALARGAGVDPDDLLARLDRAPDPTESAAAAAAFVVGLRDGDAGALAAAADAWGRAGMPYYRLVALREEGRAELDTVVTAASAREPLEQAARGFLALEARADAAETEALLRRAGVRPGVRGARAGRPRSGVAGLTSREREVAELVAAGRTNAQVASALFVSEKTVKTHLTAILRKTGRPSRLAFVAEWPRLVGEASGGAASAEDAPPNLRPSAEVSRTRP